MVCGPQIIKLQYRVDKFSTLILGFQVSDNDEMLNEYDTVYKRRILKLKINLLILGS